MRHVLVALVLMLTCSSAAWGFEKVGHGSATRKALVGLKWETLKRVLHANWRQDHVTSFSFGRDAHHFNDCGFAVAASYIREQYSEVDEALSQGDSDAALDAFGRILHAVQDFYSHSNWVDSELPGLLTDPADASGSTNDWPSLQPGPLGELAVLVTAELEGWDLARAGRRVTAQRGIKRRVGVMTGAVAGAGACPSAIVLGHWDTSAENGGLAKDSPGNINYQRAVAVAERQTRRELCRLVARASAQPASLALVQGWFQDGMFGRLKSQCAAAWWAEGELPARVELYADPSSSYAAWQLGVAVSGRWTPAVGFTEVISAGARSRRWGVDLRHTRHELIGLAGVFAPLGRDAGIFLELGTGVGHATSTPARHPLGSAAVAYEWGPWANVFGASSALRLAIAATGAFHDQSSDWAVAGDIGLRIGLPL